MSPTRLRYLGMRDGDLSGKAYAKFWNPNLKPLSERAKGALAAGPGSPSKMLTLSQADLVVKDSECVADTFGMAPDQSMHIAITTVMPDVSPEMVDWWFAWHSEEPQRYKLWHPTAHVHAQWDAKRPATIAGGTYRERYIDRTSNVWEYVGPELGYYAIQFIQPASLGLAASTLSDATAVCARVGFANVPVDFGYLLHYVRRTKNGSEMDSRFWIGGPHIAARGNNPLLRPAVEGLKMLKKPSRPNAENLLVHCAQEMAHLATFLPQLYLQEAASST